jgi:hypothetical protein
MRLETISSQAPVISAKEPFARVDKTTDFAPRVTELRQWRMAPVHRRCCPPLTSSNERNRWKRMLKNVGQMDPLPLSSDSSDLQKFRHWHDVGHRVRTRDGHPEKIATRHGEHRFTLRLDSGHEIFAHESELTPEDLPSTGHRAVSSKSSAAGFTKTLLSQFDGLRTADVSAHDRAFIDSAIQRAEDGAYATNPFDCDGRDDPEPIQCLKIMMEKYSVGKSTGGDTFVKAHCGDRVGQLIQTAIDGLHAGKNIIMPAECRGAFERVPSLQSLIPSGRICFDCAGLPSQDGTWQAHRRGRSKRPSWVLVSVGVLQPNGRSVDASRFDSPVKPLYQRRNEMKTWAIATIIKIEIKTSNDRSPRSRRFDDTAVRGIGPISFRPKAPTPAICFNHSVTPMNITFFAGSPCEKTASFA